MAKMKWMICFFLLLLACTLFAEDIPDEFTEKDEGALVTKRVACPKKCGLHRNKMKCYDPVNHQCCGGLVLQGYYSCPNCNPRSKCGNRCMPKSGYKCCHKKVIPNAWPCCRYICGGQCYDPKTHRCCRGQKIIRSLPCCVNYCDKDCYDPKVAKCCNKKVADIKDLCCPTAGHKKCGKICFNPKTNECCNSRIILKGADCCPVAGHKKCGGTCYNPGSHKCCFNRIIPKNAVCCRIAAHTMKCQKICYNPITHKCCHSQPVLKRVKCCPSVLDSKCGPRKQCYNPRRYKCCHNRVIRINADCCKTAGHKKCGSRCYDPRLHQCCKNRVIPKNADCCPKAGHKKCGKRCYNPAKSKCCHKKIIPKQVKCCPYAVEKKCGPRNKCYNPRRSQCCHNQVKPKKTPCCRVAGHKVCGIKCFNPSIHICCRDQIRAKGDHCCPVAGHKKCGIPCYNPQTQKCCKGQTIIPKNQKCVKKRIRITKGLWATSIGCYKDTANRAIPIIERQDRLLQGNYQQRKYAIEKCALAAARRGWKCFAVQHQGHCQSGPKACKTYNKYGPYNTCRNGKGGPMGNDVYRLQGVARQKTTGGEICVFPFVYKGSRYTRCTTKDHSRPWCAVTPNYDVDRMKGDCNVRSVHITSGVTAYSIGCYRDKSNRAIPPLDGKDRLLRDYYRNRKYAIEKCALAAARRGWKYFAVQHRGWCASGPQAGKTYNKYGPYNTCRNGKGGPWGNDVYILQGVARQKTTRGEICVFPFVYKRVRYTRCTMKDHRLPWCAVTPNYDVDRMRGQCGCPPGHGKCGQHCYNIGSQRCCHGRVTRKWAICCAPGHRLCIRRCYNPRWRRCCRGRVTSRWAPCFSWGRRPGWG